MTSQEQGDQYEKDLLEIAPKMVEVLDRAVTWAIAYGKASRQDPPWLNDAKALLQKIKR